MNTQYTAVIADDEPLLNQSLAFEISRLWPELSIVATAENGTDAISYIKTHKPDIVFLDIQMPGADGLEVAQFIAEDWPDTITDADDEIHDNKAPPLIVFLTAYDEHAVQAFDMAAIDYLLKPLKPERLAQTIERAKKQLTQPELNDISQLGAQIKTLLDKESSLSTHSVASELTVIRASIGDVVNMIPVDDVIFFESADKYVTVHTKGSEAIIREPLRKLLSQLNANHFVQIHRSTIVNLHYVEAALRDETGKITLRLKDHERVLTVSRIHRHLFQAM